MQEFQKIIILENENEQDAKNDTEQRIIRRSNFSSPVVEYWYRFYFSFTKYYDNDGYPRMMDVQPGTLLLTYTTFCNSVMSGYGDLLKRWLDIFYYFAQQGKRLDICVISSPCVHWELIKWVYDASTKKEKEDRLRLVVNCLQAHNLYSLAYDKYDFAQAVHISLDWWDQNYIPAGTRVMNRDGVECRVSYVGLPQLSDPFEYSIDIPVPEKGPDCHRPAYIDLESLKSLNPTLTRSTSAPK